MIRNGLGKVMWVGRATVFLVGLAVILALVFGVASTAFGANGKPFLLGKKNVASAISTLVKQGPGPALNLVVRAGQPPLKVNSSGKVANLNADKLDGLDSTKFASADSAPLWAVVNADGTIRHSSPGVTGSTRIGGGFYQLTFNRNVSSCGYSATLDGKTGGEISPYRGFFDTANTVRVATMRSDGSSTEIPFHLVVFC
jgi:hypothetical protein